MRNPAVRMWIANLMSKQARNIFLEELINEEFQTIAAWFMEMLYKTDEESFWRLIMYWMGLWIEQVHRESVRGYYRGRLDKFVIHDLEVTMRETDYILREMGFASYHDCLPINHQSILMRSTFMQRVRTKVPL